MNEVQDPQYKTPDGCALRMYRDSAQNRYLSEREGRPIFDDAIFVEVISPGSRDSTPVFELVRNFAPEMNHPAPKYGPKYAELKSYVEDFEKNEKVDASLSGTPLSQWSEMTRSMVASLRAQNIFTVDALATLPDTKLIVVGPDGRTWRTKAQAYLENAKAGAYATELAARLETTQADLAASQEQIKVLAGQIEAMQSAGATATVAKAGKTATQVAVDPAPADTTAGVVDPLAPAVETDPTVVDPVLAAAPII